jgi:hypothetical protein
MLTPQQQQQPQQARPKSSRRSGRKNRSNQATNGHHHAVMSDNDASLSADGYHSAQLSTNDQGGRKKSHTHNKTHISGNVSDNPQPSKTQATPIKQAYAGATFQQSPAASALPLPSFYSRSVPAPAAIPIADDPADPTGHSVRPETSTPSKRESTPLDFLFQAARDARTPRADSPAARPLDLSRQPHSPAGALPGPKDPESMFPFELDGASTPGEDGTPFASTYNERMNSLKSTRSSSSGPREMDEAERKAKSEALKRALMMGQIPNLRSPPAADPNNPFNARVPNPQARSGPSTPSNGINGHPQSQQHYFSPPTDSAVRRSNYNVPPTRPLSNLRYHAASEPEAAEMSSDGAISPSRISTARRQGNYTDQPSQHQFPQYAPFSPPAGHRVPYHAYPSPQQQMNSPPPVMPANSHTRGHQSKPSAQQLEDDLRKVLNLNVASNG